MAPAFAALTVSTAIGPDPVEPGETLHVALTVTNTDTFDRSNVVLRLRYPQNLNSLSNSLISDGGTCPSISCDANGNELLTWNLGTLQAGNGVTVTLPPTVAASAASGTDIDFAIIEATDASATVASTTRTVAVVADRVLELAVDEAVDPVQPGGQIAYDISYGHSKASAQVAGANLELVLPTGASFVSASGNGALVGDRVRWVLGTLGPGAGGQEQVLVQVDSGVVLGSPIVAQGRLSATGQPDTVEDEVTRVEAATPLRVTVDASPDPVAPGELTRIAVTATNTDTFERSGLVLRLRYPGRLGSLSNSLISDGGTCPSISCDANGNELLTWNLGALEGGSGITVTLPPRVNTGALKGTTISFEPQLIDSSGLRVETGRTLLVNDRRLELAIAEPLEALQPGEVVDLQVSVGNNTPSSSATGLQLRWPVPDGATFSSASGGGTLQNSQVIWNLGTLDSGEIARRRLSLLIDAGIPLGSPLASRARLTGTGLAEMRDDLVSRVESGTPLRVALEVRAPSPDALPGDTLETWLSVENTSPFDRSGVVLSLRYPEHLNSLSNSLISDGGTCPSISCDANGNEFLTWTLPSLPAGGTKEVTLPPVVSSSTSPGSLIFFDAVVADSTARSRTEYVMPIGILVEPAPGNFALAVTASGDGTVESAPVGIDCAPDCVADFPAGSQVTLTATPASGSTFTRWGGNCSGSQPTCTLTMLAARSVTATFGTVDPGEPVCPAEAAVATQPDRGHLLDRLDGLRDRVLAVSAEGRWLIDAYYRHSDEVTERLRSDPWLMPRTLGLLRLLRSDLEAAVSGDRPVVLNKNDERAIRSFAEALQRGASVELASDLARFLEMDWFRLTP